MLEHIPAERIPYVWDDMLPQLKRALKFDPDTDAMTLFGDLLHEKRQAWKVPGGYLLTEFTRTRGTLQKSLWVTHVGGKAITALTGQTEAVMGQLESLAKQNKCVSINLWGRKGWKRLLPDFSAHPIGDGRFEMRKALT